MAGPEVAVALAGEVQVAAGNHVPPWAGSFISEADFERVSAAVAKAEHTTTGEIVPMIVRRSSATGHVILLLTLFFLVSALTLGVDELESLDEVDSHWVILGMALSSFGVAWLLAKIPVLQRWLTLPGDLQAEVELRAELEFYRKGLHSTHGKTGVLLFVSLMERRAVVLADEAIAKKLPQNSWADICEMMIHGIKQGRPADGLTSAIQRSGELLAKEFPLKGENPNELSNQLILKE